jgi:site-specific DNA-methyltransferase (adenine-specific)
MLGDCLERMKEIPDDSVDMILCDLPYGTTACKWDVIIPFEPLWVQYWRICKPNSAVLLFGGSPWGAVLINSQIKHFRYDWVWNKNRVSNPMAAKKRPLCCIENINVFYRKQPTYNPQGIYRTEKQLGGNKPGTKGLTTEKKRKDYVQEWTNYPRTYLNISADNYGNNCHHPTQKPVALLEYLIKTYTNDGETVLDNTMGSGSTGVACINTNRKFIGIEKDEKYFGVATRRLAEVHQGR